MKLDVGCGCAIGPVGCMALLWLAQTGGCHRVLTVDAADFSVYRGKAGKTLDLPHWMD